MFVQLTNMKLVRYVKEAGGLISLEFRILRESGSRWMLKRSLAEELGKEYCVDAEAIESKLSEICKKYNIEDLSEECIRKGDKTAEEIKAEIKHATAARENVLREIIEFVKEVRSKQDIDGWLWRVAEFDLTKCKYIPIE